MSIRVKIQSKNIGSIFVRLCLVFLLFSCVKEVKTPTYSGFEDLDEGNNKIAIIGDTQLTSHWEFWREVNEDKTTKLLEEIIRREPVFMINLGDLVTRGSSMKHWEFFDKVHTSLIEHKIPLFPVLGNHNYYGDNRVALQNYFSRFRYLKNQKWYSFTFHNIGFLMLDSNHLELSAKEKESQLKWYQKKLQEMDKDDKVKFIVVCCHHSPFTNSMVISPSESVRENFVKYFKGCKKTAIFFTGHCHSYEKFRENGKYFIVSGGGGGPRHKVQTDKKKRKFNDLFDGPPLRFFHFCEMSIHPDKLVVDVIKLNEDSSFSNADEIIFSAN